MRASIISVLVLVAFFILLVLMIPTFKPVPIKSQIRQPRLVILYATCSLNKDYLSPYNSTIRYTPNIGDFAGKSIVFARHQTEVAFSGPAYASLLTGMFVYHHGVYYHPSMLRDNLYLMAEAFRDNDYETFYWNSHQMASPALNYAQGILPKNISYGALAKSDPKFSSILSHLKASGSYKAYIQLSFTFTHAPYSRNSDAATTAAFCAEFPNECKGITKEDLEKYLKIDADKHLSLSHSVDNTARALGLGPAEVRKLAAVLEAAYKSSVHLLDNHFGKMIEAIQQAGLFDQSLIVFTSDHGELLYREGAPISWTHAGVEPEVLNIPLIVHPQKGGWHHPNNYRKVTRSMDVFPTIAGLAGLMKPSSYVSDGEDLSKVIQGKEPEPDLVALACSGLGHPSLYQDDPAWMVVQARRDDTLYRYTPAMKGLGEELQIFDVGGTGKMREVVLNPLKESFPYAQLREYRELLIRHFGEIKDTINAEEAREKLRALGYIQ